MKTTPLILSFALLLLADLNTSAATLVSGNVSGTWGLAASPYTLIDNCVVPTGATLTLEPGATVVIGGGLTLTVRGSIKAHGTPINRIAFKSPNTNSYWEKIRLESTSNEPLPNGTGEFKYCDFRNGKTLVEIKLFTPRAPLSLPVLFVGCSFQDCVKAIEATSWTGTSTRTPLLQLSIEACVIRKASIGLDLGHLGRTGDVNSDSGSGKSRLFLLNNRFENCQKGLLATSYDSYRGGGTGDISNNVFYNCGAAVFLDLNLEYLVRNNTFYGCSKAIERNGTTSSQVGFNCFYANSKNFTGYPASFGTIAQNNQNGTPCDVAYNILEDPKFADTNSFLLSLDSPCIDAGDPTPAYNDVHFPPSRKTAVNDIGAYGGPDVLSDDADMDGLLDSWEIQYFSNLESTNGESDSDQDGLINQKEQAYATNPTDADTDHDGFNDLAELTAGASPTDPKSIPTFKLSICVSTVDLEFNTAKGRTYQLQASDNNDLWDNLLDPIPGDGTVIRKRVEISGTRYRCFKLKDVTPQ